MNVTRKEQWTLVHSLKLRERAQGSGFILHRFGHHEGPKVAHLNVLLMNFYPQIIHTWWFEVVRSFWAHSRWLVRVFNFTESTPSECWPLWNSARQNNGGATMRRQSTQPWLASISRAKWRVLYGIWQLRSSHPTLRQSTSKHCQKKTHICLLLLGMLAFFYRLANWLIVGHF